MSGILRNPVKRSKQNSKEFLVFFQIVIELKSFAKIRLISVVFLFLFTISAILALVFVILLRYVKFLTMMLSISFSKIDKCSPKCLIPFFWPKY